MDSVTTWDVAILALAAYFSITTLVRMMRTRRDVLLEDLQKQVAEQQVRKRAAERAARKKNRENQAQWSN